MVRIQPLAAKGSLPAAGPLMAQGVAFSAPAAPPYRAFVFRHHSAGVWVESDQIALMASPPFRPAAPHRSLNDTAGPSSSERAPGKPQMLAQQLQGPARVRQLDLTPYCVSLTPNRLCPVSLPP